MSHRILLSLHFLAVSASAQLVSYDGFEDYGAGLQFESGANGSAGVGLDAGSGWSGPYNINRAIKTLVKVEDRSASPVVYSNGDISIDGGTRAMRLYDVANGSAAMIRGLGETFQSSEILFFSFLFRTSASSPLSNQDFFQLGFDLASTSPTNPRVSIGANTITSTFPPSQPFRFFARSSTLVSNSAFDDSVDIAPATTYFLVGKVSGSSGFFDRVELFINPATAHEPVPSASFTTSSGAASLDTLVLRTAGLDNGDAYVFDELRVSRDWASVIPEPGSGSFIAAGLAALLARRRRDLLAQKSP